MFMLNASRAPAELKLYLANRTCVIQTFDIVRGKKRPTDYTVTSNSGHCRLDQNSSVRYSSNWWLSLSKKNFFSPNMGFFLKKGTRALGGCVDSEKTDRKQKTGVADVPRAAQRQALRDAKRSLHGWDSKATEQFILQIHDWSARSDVWIPSRRAVTVLVRNVDPLCV